MLKISLALIALVVHTAAVAQATPIGLWKTIDDESQKEKSLVRIAETGGVLSGSIEKVLDPAKEKDVCEKCSDERKGKPIVGLNIIRNAKPDGDDKSSWTGGEILDPNNGKTYRLRLKPHDGGKTLEVRGYIGPFFRNQTWIRVE
jgi:uncharacterized protein (DUF2147 family)